MARGGPILKIFFGQEIELNESWSQVGKLDTLYWYNLQFF